jgi:hypothetical protein
MREMFDKMTMLLIQCHGRKKTNSTVSATQENVLGKNDNIERDI